MIPTTSNSGSTGAGQQDPSDSNSQFAVISFIVRQMIAQLDTMKLVKIEKVSTGEGGAAGTVDVQLLVSQLDGSGNATANGVAHGIPWMRLGGGKNAVVCDPVVGDIGFVVCADRDTSSVRQKKGQANPGSYRRYNVSDGVYIGGILADAPEQLVKFTEDTIEVHDKTGNVVKLSSTGIELTPSGVLPVTVNGNLVVTGNILAGGNFLAQDGSRYAGNFSTSGDVLAGTIALKTHTHTQGADSHGDAEQPTSAPVP